MTEDRQTDRRTNRLTERHSNKQTATQAQIQQRRSVVNTMLAPLFILRPLLLRFSLAAAACHSSTSVVFHRPPSSCHLRTLLELTAPFNSIVFTIIFYVFAKVQLKFVVVVVDTLLVRRWSSVIVFCLVLLMLLCGCCLNSCAARATLLPSAKLRIDLPLPGSSALLS